MSSTERVLITGINTNRKQYYDANSSIEELGELVRSVDGKNSTARQIRQIEKTRITNHFSLPHTKRN